MAPLVTLPCVGGVAPHFLAETVWLESRRSCELPQRSRGAQAHPQLSWGGRKELLGGWGEKQGCGGNFSRLCVAGSGMLWSCALGLLLHGCKS